MIEKLKHMYRFEPEVQVIKKGSPGETKKQSFAEFKLRCCLYGGKLARLGGLAYLGETSFIPRSYEISYLSSIKKFVMSLEKECFNSKQWCKAIMQNKCFNLINIWKTKQSWLKKTPPYARRSGKN